MTTPERQILNAISPDAVRDFLLQQRFRPVEKWGKFLEVFESPTDRSKTVVAPTSSHIADYANRLSMLLNDLSLLYGDSVGNIISEIANSGYEPLKIIANEGEAEHTLTYDATIDLLRNAFRLIDYSAVVELADHPLRVVQGRRKDIIRDYLDCVRVGQTEVGSYVLTLLMPRRATGVSGGWSDPESEPFGVKVAQRLEESLVAARSAVTHEGSNVESLAQEGLTANFVNSLAYMVDAVPTVSIGMQAHRSKDRLLHKFRSSDRVSLLQIGNLLSPPENRGPISIRGTITQLSEPRKKASGQIVIETEIYGTTRPVRVPYERGDRETVMEAIEKKAEVSIEVDGTLVERRGQYHLKEPQGFRLNRRRLLT